MLITTGTVGRWAFGIVILVHCIVCNETGGATTLFAVLVATSCAIFSAICKSSLNNVQLAYMRATQKMDFFWLFLAVWMDILALLATCAALARTLSTCMDAMSGGMARIYLLGRNSPDNEPWPDVLGVSIVFLLAVMFMLGLENTKIFGYLMVSGVIGMTVILMALSGMRGTFDAWQPQHMLPKGLYGILSSAALCTFAFPSDIPTNGAYKRLMGVFVIVCVGAAAVLTAGCLSTITQYSDGPYMAVPILTVLEKQDFHKVEPGVVCLLVLACSGAFLELFPEMYGLIVKLSTAEWRILARQIGYENSDSGSPMLAIFTGGSLCAMLAFACPLQNLLYILAASHLCSGIIRAFYLLYSPFRPKYMIRSTQEASLAYSRLDAAKVTSSSTTTTSRSSSLWCFLKKPGAAISIIPTSKSMLKKSKRNEELEREWLLLGEPPQSPRVLAPAEMNTAESCILSGPSGVQAQTVADDTVQASAVALDVDGGKENNGTDSTDSTSTTDIDAIVDEYRQKVKVTTAGPMEKIIRLPTTGSWKLAMSMLATVFVSVLCAVTGVAFDSGALFAIGLVVCLTFCFGLLFLPKYANGQTTPSAFTCGVAIVFESVLLMSSLSNSWPAILFWILAGIALYVRCDTWCCYCLEHPQRSKRLIPNVTSNMTSIRIPCPPRGSLISSRISGHR